MSERGLAGAMIMRARDEMLLLNVTTGGLWAMLACGRSVWRGGGQMWDCMSTRTIYKSCLVSNFLCIIPFSYCSFFPPCDDTV